MIGVGDKVRWRRDQYPKTDPEMRTEVIAVYDDGETVRLEGGATAPARMLEVVESASISGHLLPPQPFPDEPGLMQVIEAQMAEIDRLVTDNAGLQADLERAESELEEDASLKANDEGWEKLDGATDLLGQLCIALGFDRRPGLPTGISELDALVRYVMD